MQTRQNISDLGFGLGKICTQCNGWFILEYFCADKRNRSGVGGRCFGCLAVYNRNLKQDHPEIVMANGAKWRQNNPDYMKDYFQQRRIQEPGYTARQRQAWRLQNPDKAKAQARRFNQRYWLNGRIRFIFHKMQLPSSVHNPQFIAIFQHLSSNQPEECPYCDNQLKYGPHGNVHVDHMQPIIRFPELALEPSNLQFLCASCNQRKKHRTPPEYLQSLKQLCATSIPKLEAILS